MKLFRFDASGNAVQIADDANVYLNEIGNAEIVGDYPTGGYMVAVKMNAQNQPYTVLVPITVLAQPRIELANQLAMMQSIQAEIAARKAYVPLGTVTVGETAAVLISAGERTYNRAVTGIKTTDIPILTPQTTYAVGYGWRGVTIPSDGNLAIKKSNSRLGVVRELVYDL